MKKVTIACVTKPALGEDLYGSLQRYAEGRPPRDVVEEVMTKVALAAVREGRHR